MFWFWLLNSGFSQCQFFSWFLKHSLVTHNSTRTTGSAQPTVAIGEQAGKACPIFSLLPASLLLEQQHSNTAWSLGPDLRGGKNNHFFLQWNCEGQTGFLCYLRVGKKIYYLAFIKNGCSPVRDYSNRHYHQLVWVLRLLLEQSWKTDLYSLQ